MGVPGWISENNPQYEECLSQNNQHKIFGANFNQIITNHILEFKFILLI